MRYVLSCAVVLVLVVVSATRVAAEDPAPADVKALAEALADDRLEVAVEAAKKLHALGAQAEPVLPELVRALNRELGPFRAAVHTHPDQRLLPELHLEVIGALGAIGPKAKAVVHVLGLKLIRASGKHKCAIVRALISIAPTDERTFRALSRVVANGRWNLGDEDCEALLRGWVEMQDERAGPMLAGVLARGKAANQAWAAKRLAALGKVGDAFLLHHLESAPWMEKKLVLETYVEAGRMPEAAVPRAVAWFRKDAFDGDRAAYASAIAKSCTEVCDAVGKALAACEPWDSPWRELREASPEAARKASTAWFAARRPEPIAGGFDALENRRTPLAGGDGGGAFLDLPARRLTLVGLRVTTDTHSGHTVVTSLVPLYTGPDGPFEGRRHGHARGAATEIRAPKGYAIGALYVKAGTRVDGFLAVFMKRVDDRLDPEQAIASPWIGGTGGGEAVLLGGEGRRIVGVHGRQGTDVDAIGLVESK